MRTILVSNAYPPVPLSIVRSVTPASFTLKTLSRVNEDELASQIVDADYLLASGRVSLSRATLERGRRLKMIQRTGVGLDSIDLAALRDFGIPLYVNRGVNASSVAEHALLLTLACLRRLPLALNDITQVIWRKQEHGVQTSELCGKTVGLIGLGQIGCRFARLLRAFDAKVLYFDVARLDESKERELGVVYCSLESLLVQSDVISLHCPLTPMTRNLLDKRAFSQVKRGVIVVNTARGGLIDESALIDALCSGQVAFAGLDVYSSEPISADNPLLSLANVVLTPHIGGVTSESFHRMMEAAIRNILAFEEGRFDEIEQYRYKESRL